MAYYIVVASPPEGVTEEDYNRWFDGHVRQILELPGWVAAERMALRFERSSDGHTPSYTYLVRYEIDGPFEPAWQALRTAVAEGRMHFEDWMPRMVSAGFEATSLGGRVVAEP